MNILIRCPHCHSDFKIDVRFAGQDASCAHCGGRFTVKPIESPNNNEAPSSPTDPNHPDAPDIWPGIPDLANPNAPRIEIPTHLDHALTEPNPPGDAGPAEPGPTPEIPLIDEFTDPGPAFRKDLIRLIPPVRTRAEVPTFIVAMLLFYLMPFLQLVSTFCCVSWLGLFGISGCLAAFFVTIVTETAQGADELPYLSSLFAALENVWSDIVVPISSFFISFLYVLLPLMIANPILWYLAEKGAISETLCKGILVALLVAGLFFWPIVMLILAFDRLLLLLRPDLIVAAIKAVLGPYLLCWLCLLAAFAVGYAVSFLLPQGAPGKLEVTWRTIAALALLAINLSVFIYAMRIVGLLYLHYQHRLPWRLEARTKHPLEE